MLGRRLLPVDDPRAMPWRPFLMPPSHCHQSIPGALDIRVVPCAGQADIAHRSTHMSQLIAKKPRFEVPPLNWKAPGSRPDPETSSRPETTEATQDKNATRVPD
jgi:hypothetical protein